MRVSSLIALFSSMLSTAALAAPPAADVGDADSFGRPVKYIGAKSGSLVWLRASCTPTPQEPIGPTDRCVVVSPNTAASDLEQPALLSIKLPGGSTRSLVCFAITTTPTYTLVGPATGRAQGFFQLDYSISIESNVFKNAALIDPFTNQPLNGKLDLVMGGVFETHNLNAGESASKRQTLTRECIGGLVSSSSLKGNYGLSSAQVAAFFASPMTITIGTTGRIFRGDHGSYSVGVRFYGD